jgi:hypothetical protein
MSATEINQEPPYSVGTPGQKWGDAERTEWRALVEPPSRSYAEEVLAKLEPLKERFDVVRYGALPYDASDADRYPLFAVKTKEWNPEKPSVLITGGVHGYETSGVQGALRFLDTRAAEYAARFNVCVAPCVSPWGYERIQRWNAMAVDPNRSFDKKVGLALPGGVRLVTWTVLAVINVCFDCKITWCKVPTLCQGPAPRGGVRGADAIRRLARRGELAHAHRLARNNRHG